MRRTYEVEERHVRLIQRIMWSGYVILMAYEHKDWSILWFLFVNFMNVR